ncbi:hypothetical protein [Duganella sp. Root198D2]|uniref:hypothetical protein n=1 Tax=Duganella sp. Root198D2 TaxID=1736489 RepID=UPI00070CDE50|nr:hypothetical protein [Duganella sp. Root198D2]KRC02738.1 hypothetical protein ASE26_16100 [Duganella sp. Root198D2]
MTAIHFAKSLAHILAVFACCVVFSAQAAGSRDFGCQPGTQRPGASLCLPGKTLTIDYRSKARTVSITINGSSHVVERIDRNFGPELIGMELYIRFLPMELQPYLSRNVVLFNSVVRSSGGEGMGQCGSGGEVFVNAMSISGAKARVLGKVQVESCSLSIVPANMEQETAFSEYSVVDGRLAVSFRHYPEIEGRPTGVLSSDFRQFEFQETEH